MNGKHTRHKNNIQKAKQMVATDTELQNTADPRRNTTKLKHTNNSCTNTRICVGLYVVNY